MRLAKVEGRFVPSDDGKCAVAQKGMVSTAFTEATMAGVELLAEGGNAIDAACAAGIAIGVCEPQASGLGGQTVGVVHHQGRTFSVDGSSRVPSLAHRAQFNADSERSLGYRAATVPSTLATYGWLHRHYGVLPWHRVIEPAVRIARDGYRITALQSALQRREQKKFAAVPSRSGARYFLKKDGEPYAPGDVFRQPELADLLARIAEGGVETFYAGEVAAQIEADMVRHDGLLRAEDLALIPWPVERRVLRRRYRDVLVASLPPPGAGRTLLLLLMTLGQLRSRFVRERTPRRFHFVAEAMRKVFLTRNDRPYDPNTYHQVKDKRMLSRAFARELAESIAEEIDSKLPFTEPPAVPSDTTHLSVMDADGNAVAMTQSIELVYGSKAAAADLGFLYNNFMLPLELKNPAHPYYLRPNAVPWSSATPTIVFREGAPWITVGSPGSERIFSTVSLFLSRVIDGSDTIDAAMREPRIHCSIGGTVHAEAERLPAGVLDHLSAIGYKVQVREPWAFYLGCIQATLRCQSQPGFQGVADVRRDGVAAGPS